MSNKLEKGWLTSLGVAANLLSSPATNVPDTTQQVKQAFDPSTLHPDLHYIAHLESSSNPNVKHAPHSRGNFHTAVGSVGLKPSTAHDVYSKSKSLQALYPNLGEPESFTNELKNNQTFYNVVASKHWNDLKRSHKNNPARAAFAWRWGNTAAHKASDDEINNDKYVQKFLSLKQKMNKSENLEKAIADLKPGKQIKQNKTSAKIYNYDHMLSPKHVKDGYSLKVTDYGDQIHSNIYHNGNKIGYLESEKHSGLNDHLKIQQSIIQEKDPENPIHRGKGLGTALYESLYTHAKHKAGIKHVIGDTHSTLASKVHQKLSEKHGLGYKAVPNYGEGADWDTKKDWQKVKPGPYDSKWKGYSLTLSQENLEKKINFNINPGKHVSSEGETHIYDYSHVLKPEHQSAGYKLEIHDKNDGTAEAWIRHPDHMLEPGQMDFSYGEGKVKPQVANIHKDHQGKGLGTSMYQAVIAHGKHFKGATAVEGEEHSTMASKVHQKLSQLHGFNYQPVKNNTNKAPGAYDQAFKPYKYDIVQKNFEDFIKRKG